MRKIIVTVVVLLFAVGCFLLFTKKNSMEFSEPSNATVPEPLEMKVEETLKNMTLEEKIAQMLIIFHKGTEMDEELKRELETYKPGGFILFADNISTFDSTKKLIDDIKNTAHVPMFIAMDEEGGRVQRLKAFTDIQATDVPPMLDLGNTLDPNLAYDVGTLIAEELLALGINLDFAPVLDVIENENSFMGNRSFGTDASIVSKMGLSLGHGLMDTGVIPVYKHFPGHGSTIVDSHYDLPVISKTKEELMEKDLLPFIDAIEEKAPMIMIGHLSVPSISGNTPASLSKELITDLLKEELHYDGLVITDALNMKALTKNYREEEIYEMAILAGVDLLLMPSSSEKAIQSIKTSIMNHVISEDHINESVRKILTLKYRTLTEERQIDKSVIGSVEHQEIIKKITN